MSVEGRGVVSCCVWHAKEQHQTMVECHGRKNATHSDEQAAALIPDNADAALLDSSVAPSINHNKNDHRRLIIVAPAIITSSTASSRSGGGGGERNHILVRDDDDEEEKEETASLNDWVMLLQTQDDAVMINITASGTKSETTFLSESTTLEPKDAATSISESIVVTPSRKDLVVVRTNTNITEETGCLVKDEQYHHHPSHSTFQNETTMITTTHHHHHSSSPEFLPVIIDSHNHTNGTTAGHDPAISAINDDDPKGGGGTLPADDNHHNLGIRWIRAPRAPKPNEPAVFFFFMEKLREIQALLLGATNHSESAHVHIAELVVEAWKNFTPDDRAKWDKMAREDKARYDRERAVYRGPWQVPRLCHAKDANEPKRPVMACLAFVASRWIDVKRNMPHATNRELAQTLARMWFEAPEATREAFFKEAHDQKQAYLLATTTAIKEDAKNDQVVV